MSDKDAAKRRRQARNRQERINRQKRTDAARPSRDAGRSSASSRSGRDGRPSRSATSAPSSGGFLGKLFPPRSEPAGKGDRSESPRPARVPQPRESIVLEFAADDGLSGMRGAVLRRMAQPGGRATTVALVLALMVVVMLFVVPLALRPAFPAVDAGRATQEGEGSFAEMVVRASPGTEAERTERLEALEDREPAALGTQRFTEVLSPVILAGFSLVLLLIVGTAFRSLDRPSRSRTLLITSFAVVGIMFVTPLGNVLLPLVAALAFASYQSRKADRLAAVEAATE